MKRTLLIISMIIIVLIPSSLAYWQEPTNEPVLNSISLDLRVGYFPFQTLDGIPVYDNDNKYKNNQIVSKDGIVYVVVDKNKCYTFENCPPPGSIPNAYNNPYRVVTVEWRKATLYSKGEIVLHEGALYLLIEGDGGTKNPTEIPSPRAWVPLTAGKFAAGRHYLRNSYIIDQNTIYRIDTENPYNHITDLNQYNSTQFKDSYSPTKRYKLHDAVFHEGHAYSVVNVEKANKNAPGSLHGAWNRIDTLEWVKTNTYPMNSVVWYKGNLYKASVDNPTFAPETALRQWNLMGTIHYQEFNTYPKGVNVIYKGKIYHSNVENSGVIPGTDSSVWTQS